VCDHNFWFCTQTPRIPAKEGKSYGSKKGKEKEEIRNELVVVSSFPQARSPKRAFLFSALIIPLGHSRQP
jgi:hypothetical protein